MTAGCPWLSRFSPLCPDFVAELRSPSDDLADLQAKMAGYLACGARLGWLLDPFEKHVYRRGRDVEILEHPERVDGEDVLNGFVLDSRDIL
jgi:Uma2 family endonuclease